MFVAGVCAHNHKESNFKLDKAHSYINFTIPHMVISKVAGTFESFETMLFIDQNNFESSILKGTVILESLDTKNKKRDDHLNSDDFFNSAKYPNMTLTSKKISRIKKSNSYQVTCDLTIKDITKEVSFEVDFLGPVKGFNGKKRVGLQAEFEIDRFDYGLNWNAAIETGELVAGRTVSIELIIEAEEI